MTENKKKICHFRLQIFGVKKYVPKWHWSYNLIKNLPEDSLLSTLWKLAKDHRMETLKLSYDVMGICVYDVLGLRSTARDYCVAWKSILGGYINFYRSLNCNRQVNMVYAKVSSSRFHYLFISVAELKGPYSVFNFEGYKISFRESLMSLIFPWFSLSRGNHTNLKLYFCIGNIIERNNFGHETKKLSPKM